MVWNLWFSRFFNFELEHFELELAGLRFNVSTFNVSTCRRTDVPPIRSIANNIRSEFACGAGCTIGHSIDYTAIIPIFFQNVCFTPS